MCNHQYFIRNGLDKSSANLPSNKVKAQHILEEIATGIVHAKYECSINTTGDRILVIIQKETSTKIFFKFDLEWGQGLGMNRKFWHKDDKLNNIGRCIVEQMLSWTRSELR